MGGQKETYLLHQQLPINPNSSLPILSAIFSQTSGELAHAFQTVSTVQEILNILCHHLGYISEFIIYLVEILRRATVLVNFACTLDKGIEFDECVWSQVG